MSNPALASEQRKELVGHLMAARRAVGAAKRVGDKEAEAAARGEVDRTKTALGERGPPWWTDGAPDLNRATVKSTDYAEWYECLGGPVDPDRI
jgi:hypothetical protein